MNERSPIPVEYDDYLLARHFGWTKREIDEQPGHFTDWCLELLRTESSEARRQNGA